MLLLAHLTLLITTAGRVPVALWCRYDAEKKEWCRQCFTSSEALSVALLVLIVAHELEFHFSGR